MRSLLLLPPLLAVVAAPPAQAPTFRYQPGDVLLAVEHEWHRETDARLGYALAQSHTTERRYTVLAVDADGTADVLVEETRGPATLHEYTVQGRNQRAAHQKKGFDADSTRGQRLVRAKFPPQRCRTEPARDEPSVFYLQELPELLAHVLTLPGDDRTRWQVQPVLERLQATFDLQRHDDTITGTVALSVTDPRVQDGKPVTCPAGSVSWVHDRAAQLPRHWRLELHYPRFPINRPNHRVLRGELWRAPSLDGAALATLQRDVEQCETVRSLFFAARFPAALAAARDFLQQRPDSELAPVVQHEITAFERQVPRFGQPVPELAVQQAFGAEAPRLAALRGSVVVLDFWATWCVPCIAGMPHLIELQERHGKDGLRVLGLTRLDDKQSMADVETFFTTGYAQRHGGQRIPYPLVVLDGNALHQHFGIRAIPRLVVLDRDGNVYFEQTGSGGEARLDRVVAALLAP